MSVVRRATILSLVASVIIMAVKFGAYSLTDSTAILSDALESIINVLAAAVTLVLMRYVALPADDNHPYGHGKLEYFSAAFEGGLIAFAGLVIAREAVLALWFGRSLNDLDNGIFLATGAAVMNLALGLYIKRVGSKERSAALVASGEHILSDVWSTAGTLVGLLLVKFTGIPAFDAILALVIAANLSWSGYKIFRRSASGLVDEIHPETLDELAKTFNANRMKGVIDIHLTKVIRSGAFHHVDSHLVLPEFWSLKDSHPFVEAFEKRAIKNYPEDGEINFHIDPCLRRYCSHCAVEPCPVRERPFESERPFTPGSLISRAKKDV